MRVTVPKFDYDRGGRRDVHTNRAGEYDPGVFQGNLNFVFLLVKEIQSSTGGFGLTCVCAALLPGMMSVSVQGWVLESAFSFSKDPGGLGFQSLSVTWSVTVFLGLFRGQSRESCVWSPDLTSLFHQRFFRPFGKSLWFHRTYPHSLFPWSAPL